MFSKIKKVAILMATSVLLATSFGESIVSADTVADPTNDTTTATTDSNTTETVNSSSNPEVSIDTSTSYLNIDTVAVKNAMFNELNRLRAQNGLSALTSVDILNNYAQSRADSFVHVGGVDNHANWRVVDMYPYVFSAEENISQMPFPMIGTTDPDTIAKEIINEFYVEAYDKTPNYGHRKNMLNPYINYVGIGMTISSYGMLYFTQEMGNDQAANDQYDHNDITTYNLTRNNDYANPSKYDLAAKKNADYASRDNYQVADMRGGVTTKNSATAVYDRYGTKRTDLELSPNSDWLTDLVATIDGSTYYHVSDNGFVSATDVLPWASFLYGSSITATTDAKVYDNNGVFTGRAVKAGSKWDIGPRAVNPLTDVKMYRIDTNAWIQANQCSLN